MKIEISICPTDLEVGCEGDRYDEGALLDAIREFVAGRCGRDAEVDVQIGHRQGDAWAAIDGDDEAGEALLNEFWEEHGDDEDLFAGDPIDVELSTTDETIRTCAVEEYTGLEHPGISEVCDAYHAAAAAAIADDPRAARLNVCHPKGSRLLHSQWMGARFDFTRGAFGVFCGGSLTDDEKAAIEAADDAGRAAAKAEAERWDAAEAQ